MAAAKPSCDDSPSNHSSSHWGKETQIYWMPNSNICILDLDYFFIAVRWAQAEPHWKGGRSTWSSWTALMAIGWQSIHCFGTPQVRHGVVFSAKTFHLRVYSILSRCNDVTEYVRISVQTKEFFHQNGIHSITVQAEFHNVRYLLLPLTITVLLLLLKSAVWFSLMLEIFHCRMGWQQTLKKVRMTVCLSAHWILTLEL